MNGTHLSRREAGATLRGAILLAVLLAGICPAPSRALISRCEGPRGELLYTDRECPPGYALRSTIEQSPPGSGPPPAPAGAAGMGPEAVGEEPSRAAPAAAEHRPEARCRSGTFTTGNRISYYVVWFENAAEAECLQVSAYCLCSLSAGAYRQSRTISATGRFKSREKVRIGEVETTGPAGRDIDWSWCDFD